MVSADLTRHVSCTNADTAGLCQFGSAGFDTDASCTIPSRKLAYGSPTLAQGLSACENLESAFPESLVPRAGRLWIQRTPGLGDLTWT